MDRRTSGACPVVTSTHHFEPTADPRDHDSDADADPRVRRSRTGWSR